MSRVLLLLFFASGASGLLYEVVWTRSLALHFGATAPSLAAVLSTCMGGLSLGSALAARWAQRLARPLRAYGLLELGIAALAWAVPGVIALTEPLLAWAYPRFGPGPSFDALRFGVAVLALLPPTLLMGATLPVLARVLVHRPGEEGARAGAAYAINTLGGMAGAFLSGFVLIRLLGMTATIALAAATNAAIGGVALLIAHRWKATLAPEAPWSPAPVPPGALPSSWIVTVCGFSGFASLAYEVLWTRYFVNSFHSTVAAFSTILIAYLGGLGLGAALASRAARTQVLSSRHLAILQGAIALSVLLLLGSVESVSQWYGLLVGRFSSNQAAQAVLVVAVMLVPTVLMGMVLPVGMQLLSGRSADVARTVGAANAASALGSALGPLAAAFVLLPALGAWRSVVVIAAAQAVLAVVISLQGSARRVPLGLAFGAAGVAVLLLAVRTPESGRLLPRYAFDPALDRVVEYRESAHGTLVVTEHGENRARGLFLDGFQATGDGPFTEYMRMMAHLPLLAHPAPHSALVICLGTGITLGSAALHGPGQLDCAELNPDVVACAPQFAQQNHQVLSRPGTRVHVDDGRNFLRRTASRYDVITLEPLPPYFAGTVSLYTREFNQLARARLHPGGVFAQWLPMHLVTDPEARMIVRAVTDVFAHVVVWRLPEDMSAIILASDRALDFQRVEQARPEVLADLARFGLDSRQALDRHLLLDEAAVARYVRDAAPLIDDHPVVEYSDIDAAARRAGGMSVLKQQNIAGLLEARGPALRSLVE